uniref:Uncharacterized protein n=1 Tax=Arundo donax TaxID=35708 RepID=A0A0A9GDL9_ARUDO
MCAKKENIQDTNVATREGRTKEIKVHSLQGTYTIPVDKWPVMRTPVKEGYSTEHVSEVLEELMETPLKNLAQQEDMMDNISQSEQTNYESQGEMTKGGLTQFRRRK